uniref:OTU domain-containing protein n=1 Tax=Syphacia muris TaxID=451379 RepID=A0A0N5A9B6_9BILA
MDLDINVEEDGQAEVGISALEELKAKHRKEKKELLAKITNLKHSVGKDEKKRRKEIGAAIEKMEKDMKDRHEKELLEIETTLPSKTNLELSSVESEEKKVEDALPKQPRVSKASKRRAKKVEMQKRMEKASAEAEEASKFSAGKLEMDAINSILLKRNLRLHEIPPNGDCLYNAIAHQMLSVSGNFEITGVDVRRKAATYIRAHEEEFLPFLTWEDGSPIDEMEFEKYCFQVESTSEKGGQWGGEPELRALSNVLERKIEVLQPEGRATIFGEQYSEKKPLVITYHRHAYSLGEHYNSTVAIVQT